MNEALARGDTEAAKKARDDMAAADKAAVDAAAAKAVACASTQGARAGFGWNADQRAATVTVVDHQYVRILDVAAALESRAYGSAGRVVFEMTDPLGIDAGRFALAVDESGRGVVTRDVADEADATLSTVELSALFIGGTSAQTLVSAGRLSVTSVGVAAQIDAMFLTATEPRLSFWY